MTRAALTIVWVLAACADAERSPGSPARMAADRARTIITDIATGHVPLAGAIDPGRGVLLLDAESPGQARLICAAELRDAADEMHALLSRLEAARLDLPDTFACADDTRLGPGPGCHGGGWDLAPSIHAAFRATAPGGALRLDMIVIIDELGAPERVDAAWTWVTAAAAARERCPTLARSR